MADGDDANLKIKDDFYGEVIREDIKNELRIISDMLNNPELYKKMGARTNNGVILEG